MKRVEFLQRDMQLPGKEGSTSWVRTKWLSYMQRLPMELRDALIGEIVDTYLEKHLQTRQPQLMFAWCALKWKKTNLLGRDKLFKRYAHVF